MNRFAKTRKQHQPAPAATPIPSSVIRSSDDDSKKEETMRQQQQPIVDKKEDETILTQASSQPIDPVSSSPPTNPSVVANNGELREGYIQPLVKELEIVPHIDHLPEKYRNMRFLYRFRDPVTHGLPHSSRGQDLKLRMHSPLEKLKSALPSSFSLRDHVGRVLDQGSIGACVAHSGVQAVALVTRKNDAERWFLSRALKSSSHFYGSRLFLYDNARRIDGISLKEDSGTTNLTGCMAIEKHKLCDESIWPYVESNYSTTPPNSAYTDADRHTSFRYSIVSQDATSIKKAIASGHPVMIGIVVFPSFIQCGLDNRKGNVEYPHPHEVATGGHSLLLVAYDDDTQRFTFVNHWTTQWGDGGFGTLPYRYLEDSNYSGDFCAVEEFV